MILALITLWRHPRIASVSLICALVVILVGCNANFSYWLGRSLEWQNLPPANLPDADVIVVLGGATNAPLYPRPWVDLREAGDRPIHGAQLYLNGKAPKIIMSGGRINWKNSGQPESSDMAAIAKALGVSPQDIIEEQTSLNTYQNGVNVKQILEREGLRSVLLVTSAIHMPRSLKIFEKLEIETIPAPTDFQIVSRSGDFSNSLKAQVLEILPDVERLHYSTLALKEYIGMVVYRLRGWL